MNPYALTAAICAGAFILIALILIRGRRDSEKQINNRWLSSWGKGEPQLLLKWDRTRGGSLSRDVDASKKASGGSPSFYIDDTTADDLGLDDVFKRICLAASDPGREVMYSWLRHPLTGDDALRLREAAGSAVLDRGEGGEDVFRILASMPTPGCGSYHAAIDALFKAEPIGGRKYILPSALTAIGIAMLFFMPLAAILILIPVLFIDFYLHIRMREKIRAGREGAECVLSLMRAQRELDALGIDEVKELTKDGSAAAGSFEALRRLGAFIASDASLGGGIGASLLEYLKMLFHFDLIVYDRVLGVSKSKRDEAMALLASVGSVDAAASAAALIKTREGFSRPVFSDDKRTYRVRGLIHPLIDHCIPNSVETERPLLITGSNASGKSTFLKSAGIAAIMAQSLGLAAAKYYEAPMYRIISSMSASDDIKGGESYFTAEIRSLKRIVDAASEEGAPVLALIDEILRGTNTVERVAASSQVLIDIAGMNTVTFAATHDMELTWMCNGTYRNMHFSEKTEGDNVIFDYTIKEGPADGRNAIALLARAGFPEETVKRADEMAKEFDRNGRWRQ